MQHAELNARIEEIERLMAERLHLPARTGLSGLLRGARGRLPRRALREARELETVRAMLATPGAAGAVDVTRATETCAMLERHLQAVPPEKYRRRARSALWGGIAWQMLIVFGLFLAVLRWRGLV